MMFLICEIIYYMLKSAMEIPSVWILFFWNPYFYEEDLLNGRRQNIRKTTMDC